MHVVCANIFGAIVLKPRFKIDAVIMIICSCAAKALFSCPAIISQRLESRIISKEPQENTEEESKII